MSEKTPQEKGWTKIRWWECPHFWVDAGEYSGWSGVRAYWRAPGFRYCVLWRWHRGEHYTNGDVPLFDVRSRRVQEAGLESAREALFGGTVSALTYVLNEDPDTIAEVVGDVEADMFEPRKVDLLADWSLGHRGVGEGPCPVCGTSGGR